MTDTPVADATEHDDLVEETPKAYPDDQADPHATDPNYIPDPEEEDLQ